MKNIIAFCGVIGSGKDYKAKEFVSKGYKKFNFADPLKQILFKTLKIQNTDHDYYEIFKNSCWSPTSPFSVISGRQFLQLGNHARHILNENIWVDAWEKNIKDESNVVVSDCRYLNETQRIISLGGEIYFCNYKSIKYNSNTEFESEKMAQELIKQGFKDGDNLTKYFIKKIDEVI